MNEGHRNQRSQPKQPDLQRAIGKKRWLRVLACTLLGLFLVISLHVGIAVATGQPHDGFRADQAERSPSPQTLAPSAMAPLSNLVQQAEDRYDAGQLADAIALWQQAEARYEANGDRRNQALVLSFLATAFDALGSRNGNHGEKTSKGRSASGNGG